MGRAAAASGFFSAMRVGEASLRVGWVFLLEVFFSVWCVFRFNFGGRRMGPQSRKGEKGAHGMEGETSGEPVEIEASRDIFLLVEGPGRRATLTCQCGDLRCLARLGISSSTSRVAVPRHRMMEAGDTHDRDWTERHWTPGRMGDATGEDAARLKPRLAFCCLAPCPAFPQRCYCRNGTAVDS
jgi:hypothetical protein